MYIRSLHGLFDIFGKQTFINKRFCGLGRELHHHSCRGVRVHIRVLPCDVSRLRLDDFFEDLT